METYLQTVRDEWIQLINDTDPRLHQLATDIASEHALILSREFYSIVLADPNVAEFLITDQVEKQLREALSLWLIDVLSCTT